MRTFLKKGVCPKCNADEVIAYSGHRGSCSRCDEKLWRRVARQQKTNYMKYGSVYGEKKFAKK